MTNKKLDLMEEAVALSNYHFNKDRIDPRFDGAQVLGRFEGEWEDEIKQMIEISNSRSFGTRNLASELNLIDPHAPEGDTEQYTELMKEFKEVEEDFFKKTDLDYYGYPIINKTNEIGPKVTALFNAFKFSAPATYTVHIQKIGQIFPYHIDFFHRRRWKDVPQDKLIRIQVMLNDWEPGQCLGYGNSVYTGWKAGEFHTFDHASVPHWTSNANYTPRVSLLITGVKTPETEDFLYRARTQQTITP
jgi:hypothetical protein